MSEGQDVQRTAKAVELSSGMEVGGYVIQDKIGVGGMGVVYGATHPRIGKRVAIKILAPAFSGDPSTVERFEQEARLVNEIRHPNIVDVFQFGQLADGRSYFVMEWLDGESISARLDRGPMPARETVEVVDAICDALEAAHEKGVIHRDLKSDNVFLVPVRKVRKVKLLDFGLAKLSGRGDPLNINTTKSGIVVGTPAYMSPEQARGKSVDHRTDIYALGCLTYKMLTGQLPFVADNAMDLIIKQMNETPTSPSKLAPATPPQLSRMVLKMMAKAPEERPSLAEIRQLFADLNERAIPPTKPRRATSFLIGAMLFSAGVITVGVIALIKQREDAAAAQPAPARAPALSAASGATPAGSTPPVVATPPAGTRPVEVGSAAVDVRSAAPAVVPSPTIEFEDDAVGGTLGKKPVRVATAPVGATAGSGSAAAPPFIPKPTVGTLMLMLDISSTIEIDDKVIAQDSRGGKFEVLPGPHTVRIKAPGREAVTRTLEVEPYGTTVMRIGDDTSATKPPPPKPDGASVTEPAPPPALDKPVP